MENITNKIVIKKSSIKNAGKGIFTKEKLKAKLKIGQYKGRLISKKIYNTLSDTRYTFELSKKIGKSYKLFYIDAQNKKESNWLRYINGAKTKHQKKMINIEAYQYNEKIFYRTTKEIKAGAELIIDYGDSYWL
ncbi:MAG: hypothetical protein CMP11_02870 [Zetaproteobacteria bacterium]|nr:hypothetical protein [Pseudobdellovibrionaceae bacterium]|tara:strand:- start:857 stop:1258 length:402 start_codon:yes stop_codon:yes gene_type:complete